MTSTTIYSILAGLAILVFISVRQMRWSPVTVSSLLKMPVILGIVGLVLATQTYHRPGAPRVGTGDLLFIAVEVGIAALGGWLMGRKTQIATIGDRTQSRLTAVGLGIWFGFLAIRIGGEVIAHLEHLTFASSTPMILFMVAIVKAVQAVTVRERVLLHQASRSEIRVPVAR